MQQQQQFWLPLRGLVLPAVCVGLLAISLVFSGCETDVVHRKSVAQLNQSAAEHMAQGDYAGAVARLESALELAPESDVVRYNLAMAYVQAGQTEKGAAALEAFIKTHPSDERAWDGRQTLAVVYQQLGAERMPVKGEQADEEGMGQGQSADTLSGEGSTATPPKDEAQARAFYSQSLTLLKELAEHTHDEQQQQLIAENIRHVEAILSGQPPQVGALPPQS